MAREILFKAKRADNSRWEVGYYFNAGEKHFLLSFFTNENGLYYEIYEIEPETLCQFTGLYDKNGNKIWENDIVCTPYVDPIFGDMVNDTILKDYTWNVTFTDGCFCVENEDKVITLRCFTNGKHVEVSGNIFDNPELLEERV